MNSIFHLIALAFGMSVLLMPTLATAQAVATVNVVSPATVIAKGAAVDVSVQVSCNGFNSAFGSTGAGINVQLSERVGNGISSGNGGSFNPADNPITCDGSPQTFQVVVTSFNARFAKGTAVAQAFVSVQNTGEFVNAQQTKQIQLVK